MARRGRFDPLKPTNTATWLVVRDVLSQEVERTEIAPGADLRKILNDERAARIAAGWDAEEIPTLCSFFFCKRDGIRVFVSIEMQDPRLRHGY